MVSFELDKEIEIDVFVFSRAWNKEKILSSSSIRDACSTPHGDSESFPLSHARDKTRNIFLYFFTELKTYHLPYSFLLRWTHQINNRSIFRKLRVEIKLDFESSSFSWKGKLRSLTREIHPTALYQNLVPIMKQGV